MAYLDHTRLKCPTCGFKARIKLVVSVGPGTRRGDVPGKYFHDAAPYTEGRTKEGIGQLLCPNDGTLVWTNQPTQHAYGPLTEKEMRGSAGHRWLVPDTQNPFSSSPRRPNSQDPFSGRKLQPQSPVKRG